MGPIGSGRCLKLEVENLPSGDTVACVTRRSPPNPFDGVSVADLKVVQKVAEGGAFPHIKPLPWQAWMVDGSEPAKPQYLRLL